MLFPLLGRTDRGRTCHSDDHYNKGSKSYERPAESTLFVYFVRVTLAFVFSTLIFAIPDLLLHIFTPYRSTYSIIIRQNLLHYYDYIFFYGCCE